MYIAACDDQIEELEKLTALLQAWQSDLHSDVRFQTFRSGGQLQKDYLALLFSGRDA